MIVFKGASAQITKYKTSLTKYKQPKNIGKCLGQLHISLYFRACPRQGTPSPAGQSALGLMSLPGKKVFSCGGKEFLMFVPTASHPGTAGGSLALPHSQPLGFTPSVRHHLLKLHPHIWNGGKSSRMKLQNKQNSSFQPTVSDSGTITNQ